MKAFRRAIYHRAKNRQSNIKTTIAGDLDCSSCLPYSLAAALEVIAMELPRGHPAPDVKVFDEPFYKAGGQIY